MKSLFYKKLFILLSCIFFIFSLVLYIFWGPSYYSINFPTYDTRPIVYESDDVRLFKKKINTTKYKASSLAISFDFIVFNERSYANLFQTASFNEGLRLEISSENQLLFLIGNFADKQTKGYVIKKKLEKFKQYKIKILIDESILRFYLNDELVIQDWQDFHDFYVNDIIIGNGFDKKRPFSGKIEEFNLNVNLVKSHRIVHLIIITIIINLFLLIISSFLVLRRFFLKPISFQNRIKLISGIVFSGFTLSMIYHVLINAIVRDLPYPFNSFLSNPLNQFTDFTHIYNSWHNLLTPFNTNSTFIEKHSGLSITPTINLLSYLFSLIKPVQASLFFYFSIFSFFYFSIFYSNFKTYFSPLGAIFFSFIIGCFCYPTILAIDRGNQEIYYFLFLNLFINTILKSNIKSSILFSILAIGMKPFAVVYLAFWMNRKNIFKIASFLIGFIFFSVIVGLLLSNIFHVPFISDLTPLNSYYADYVIEDAGLAFGSSLYGLIKIIVKYFNLPCNFKSLAEYYFYGACASFIFVIFTITKHKWPLWKAICFLTLTMCLLPHVSPDYRLINLLIPMMLFINNKKFSDFDIIYSILFGVLFVPKSYYYLFKDVSISCLLNPIITVIFMTVLLIDNRNCNALDEESLTDQGTKL